MADTVGKRPTGKIPKGHSTPSGTTDPYGGTDAGGGSHTKTPTGPRPMPVIPRHVPPHATVPGAMKAPIKHTPMPAPNKDRLTGAPKSEGGGSY
jgi:hypothetical protein